MGTTYSVKLTPPADGLAIVDLRDELERTLAGINRSMSTYRPDSELSHFNRSDAADWVEASGALHTVLESAAEISALSNGAFDVTVGPLVDLWGFGPSSRAVTPPATSAIERALERIGHQRLDVAPRGLRKSRPDIHLDLSSIAKGYAVDRLAALLDGRGVSDYLLEIGGDMRAKGVNADRRAWRIAIEQPTLNRRNTGAVIGLSDHGVATSGVHRNFFRSAGRHYAHIIDPNSGWPVSHPLAAVTVIEPSAMHADAWATALLVLGPVAGHRLAERHGLAASFTSLQNGQLDTRNTAAFTRFQVL